MQSLRALGRRRARVRVRVRTGRPSIEAAPGGGQGCGFRRGVRYEVGWARWDGVGERTASTSPGCSSSGTTTVIILPATHTRARTHTSCSWHVHVKRPMAPCAQPGATRRPVQRDPVQCGARAPNSIFTSKLSPGLQRSGTVTTSCVSFRRSALSSSGGRPCSLCAAAANARAWAALRRARGVREVRGAPEPRYTSQGTS